jgi:hypothetical protein
MGGVGNLLRRRKSRALRGRRRLLLRLILRPHRAHRDHYGQARSQHRSRELHESSCGRLRRRSHRMRPNRGPLRIYPYQVHRLLHPSISGFHRTSEIYAHLYNVQDTQFVSVNHRKQGTQDAVRTGRANLAV